MSINITNKSDENQILINCQTDFNDNLYSTTLNFNNEEIFLNCSSSNEK